MDISEDILIVQGILLAIAILGSIFWIFYCRKQKTLEEYIVYEYEDDQSNSKSSRYSVVDLQSLGISLQDYLYPPPTYIEVLQENLDYLDLELGGRRSSVVECELESVASVGKLRLVGSDLDKAGPSLVKLSVASCSACNSLTPVYLAARGEGCDKMAVRKASRMSSISNAFIPSPKLYKKSPSLPEKSKTSPKTRLRKISIVSNRDVPRLQDEELRIQRQLSWTL